MFFTCILLSLSYFFIFEYDCRSPLPPISQKLTICTSRSCRTLPSWALTNMLKTFCPGVSANLWPCCKYIHIHRHEHRLDTVSQREGGDASFHCCLRQQVAMETGLDWKQQERERKKEKKEIGCSAHLSPLFLCVPRSKYHFPTHNAFLTNYRLSVG